MQNALIITLKDHLACRWLFQKKQAQSVRLPRMQAALWLAIMRENYLAIVWNNDIPPDPQLPLPQNFGWKLKAEMSGVIATSSAVKTQKATHIIKKNKKTNKQTNKKPKLFLLKDIFKERKSQGDFNNLVNDLWLSDRVLGSYH